MLPTLHYKDGGVADTNIIPVEIPDFDVADDS